MSHAMAPSPAKKDEGGTDATIAEDDSAVVAPPARGTPPTASNAAAGRSTDRGSETSAADPETSYERLWSYYLEPITREKEKLPGGIVLRRKKAICNLLRYKSSVFRQELHAEILRLDRSGNREEIHRMLRDVHDHDRSGRDGDGPAHLLEEILGRKSGDGEIEVLDSDAVAAMLNREGSNRSMPAEKADEPAKKGGVCAARGASGPTTTTDVGHGSRCQQGQELAWQCHKCARHNPLHQLKCSVCSSWKGRSKSSTRTSTEGCHIVRTGAERHDVVCFVCGDGGELICCDEPGCTKVYHGSCIGVEDPGALSDPWYCPSCCDANVAGEKPSTPPSKQAEPPAEGTVVDNGEEDKKQPSSTSVLEKHQEGTTAVIATPVGDSGKALPTQSNTREKKKKRKQQEEEEKETEKKKRKKEQEEGEEANKCNDDSCYICDNGGFLICCDYCDKAFHMKCHVPPLLDVPEGDWKCCECSASKYSKRNKCGLCKECLQDDCGECRYCLDMPKFGGPCLLKQVCLHKRCKWKRYAPTAVVTPEMKKRLMLRHEQADKEALIPVEEEFMDGKKLGEMFEPTSTAEDTTASPGNDNNETLDNSDEVPTAAAASGGDFTDVLSLATLPPLPLNHETLPLSQVNHNAVAGVSGVAGNGVANGSAHTPNDLVMCQMELERARSEITRQANEIKRLKSAVRALTAVLTE